MSDVPSPHHLAIQAMSRTDDLCFLGQQAVTNAMEPGTDYRIVGGNMVRLLGLVYPTPGVAARATVDADAAVDDIEIIPSVAQHLLADDFTQESGNLFAKTLPHDRRIEVNLLMPHRGTAPRMIPQDVPGVGQVDTLPELVFVMAQSPLVLHLTVTLTDGEVVEYTTHIPSLEAAVVLKAHAWRGRLEPKDLVDLASLLEIRDAHPETAWRLNSAPLRSARRESADILHKLRTARLAKAPRPGSGPGTTLPRGVDRLRMSAHIQRHVANVPPI